ncbi:hypothetical protein [Rhizobium sp. CAU 1783]
MAETMTLKVKFAGVNQISRGRAASVPFPVMTGARQTPDLLLAPPLPCHRGIRLFGAALSWLERCRHGAEPQSRLAFWTAKRSVFVALSLKQPCKELNARMIAAKPILCASQRRSPGQDPAFRQILFRKSRPGRPPLGIDADAGGSDRLTKNANQLFSLPRS